MSARAWMVMGTASGVGKSLIAAGLCRLLARRGILVAPFKAQNMSLNAAVVPGGGEIGRAQALQAIAAGLPLHTDFNPVLLKPESDGISQVVVNGKVHGKLDAAQFLQGRDGLRGAVDTALARLRRDFDVLVIEGAGSPAEINLQARDLANRYTAFAADARVILVGDIDRGGVFAHLYGTLALMGDDLRAKVKGLLINKFRGRQALLDSGLCEIERLTGVPVVGVVPWIRGLALPDEDAQGLTERDFDNDAKVDALEIAVCHLPHISNTDDFEALAHEPGVRLRFTSDPTVLAAADLVILPGCKATVADLHWLSQVGLAQVLHARAQRAAPIVAVCGGAQMLGRWIDDPHRVESAAGGCAGLGLLAATTSFDRQKVTTCLRGTFVESSFFGGEPTSSPLACVGYFIHSGRLHRDDTTMPALDLQGDDGQSCQDGARDGKRRVFATMLHGLFDQAPVRHQLLRELWRLRGHDMPVHMANLSAVPPLDVELDRLADCLERHLDRELLRDMAG